MRTNILDFLEDEASERRPDSIAIEDGDRSFTFAELIRYAKTCGTLLALRVGTINQPICVFLSKGATTIFADLGIVYSGNIYCNLDVKSPDKRIHNVLNNVGPVLVITSPEHSDRLRRLGVDEDAIFLVDGIFEENKDIDDELLRQRLDSVIDTDPLCIVNTSGSTGVPKGVVLNHRSTIDFVDWAIEYLELDGAERIGSLSPYYFDIYTLELNYCLAKGATMVVIPEELAVFPVKLVEFLSVRSIGFIFWVPTIMVNISTQELLDRYDLSSIRNVFFAGEVFPMKHLNRWRKAIPEARFVNLYGPIEISVDCTYFVLDREFDDNDALPIGFPCRNTDVLILDDADRPCETDVQGELCVRGSSLALGYWNDPEKTAKAFVQNPLNSHYPEPIYRTGDLVFRNGRGEIIFVGRKDFQIKHLGYRIELPEIEQQTLNVEGIANACVLYNSPKKEITLFYETSSDGVTPASIRTRLAEIFPKYMLPTAFHRLDALPLNPNGKIDRNGLANRLTESA